jgi:hypothetical protein
MSTKSSTTTTPSSKPKATKLAAPKANKSVDTAHRDRAISKIFRANSEVKVRADMLSSLCLMILLGLPPPRMMPISCKN